jgi:hypothetical protein
MQATATLNTAPQTPALSTQPISLADAALAYANMGWSIFPLAPRSKSPLKGTHGYKDATTDLATIRAWWTEHPDANIGLAPAASNLVVLDVDPRHGGHLTLADLEAKHGPLPWTVESQTGSGGRHIFFQCPTAPVRTGSNALGPGLDILLNSPYAVLSPSIHPNGRAYMWEASSEPGMIEITPMPEWMVELLSAPRTHPTPISNTSYWGEDVVVGSSSKRGELDQALARLLGIDVPVGAKFLCLLHDEQHPSAWLFWGKGGDLLYRCEHHGGYTLNMPTLRASLHEGRIVKLRGARQHQHHRLYPLLAAGVVELREPVHMPLPGNAPKPAEAWYAAFLWTAAFNNLAFPGNQGTIFSQRFAAAMTRLSEKDEQAAAKWLLQHDYVQKVDSYKAYGKVCNLLAPGPGPEIELLDLDEVEVTSAAD